MKGTVGVAPLVGHKQNTVSNPSDFPVVVPFIQKAGLCCRGFWREIDMDRKAFRVKLRCNIFQKTDIGCAVLWSDILKIYIQPGIALLGHGGNNLSDERILQGKVVKQAACAGAAEGSVLGNRGYQHDGRNPELPCQSNERLVVNGYEHAGFCEAVAEDCKSSQVGERLHQHIPVDIGVCVAIHGDIPGPFIPVGNRYLLTGIDGRI